MTVEILTGDCRAVLAGLPEKSVHCCVTSPPYFGLRDYGTGSWTGGRADCDHRGAPQQSKSSTLAGNGHGGEKPLSPYLQAQSGAFRDVCGKCGAGRVDSQIGLEATPDAFVAQLVAVFREVRRVLRDDGTLWLNLGDSYANDTKWGGASGGKHVDALHGDTGIGRGKKSTGLKAKDLIGIPWRVAFALQQPWTDWQIKSEAMRAWVAGIVDGEGCISIMQTKSSHSESLSFPPIVQVRMTDLEPLERLVSVVGSSLGKPQMPPSHAAARQRPSWQWKIVSDQAAKVIAEIYPFLTCKRKQAVVAWNHQQFRFARGNQARSAGDIEKEQFCKTLINDLNQRRLVDIPSWMIEPVVVQEPGYYLRQDLIWSKPNPMPESVGDRCTKSHEYIFLLSKLPRYFYDADAIKEPASGAHARKPGPNSLQRVDRTPQSKKAGVTPKSAPAGSGIKANESFHAATGDLVDFRNKRSVWTVGSEAFSEAHFATFPPALIEPCILAGCPVGGTVLDPFGGAGTTGLVADRLQRNAVLIEFNPKYAEMARRRVHDDAPLFAEAAQ